MKTKTIIVKCMDKWNGGYDYVEFSTDTKEFTTGNNTHHWGHGNPLLAIEIGSKKKLNEHIEDLKLEGYREIETFQFRPNYKGAK